MYISKLLYIKIVNNLQKFISMYKKKGKVLQISRSTYYYEAKPKSNDTTLDATITIIKIFKESCSI